MKKVVIEITPNGWTTTIHVGDKTFTERHKITPTGAISEGKLLHEHEGEIDESLVDAIRDGFYPYNVMIAM